MSAEFDKLRALLEQQYVWPAAYTFKFVIKAELLDEFKAKVTVDITATRESGGGKYLAITAQKLILHTEQVIDIYQQAQQIKGIISL